jgi:hypothetical protein
MTGTPASPSEVLFLSSATPPSFYGGRPLPDFSAVQEQQPDAIAVEELLRLCSACPELGLPGPHRPATLQHPAIRWQLVRAAAARAGIVFPAVFSPDVALVMAGQLSKVIIILFRCMHEDKISSTRQMATLIHLLDEARCFFPSGAYEMLLERMWRPRGVSLPRTARRGLRDRISRDLPVPIAFSGAPGFSGQPLDVVIDTWAGVDLD